MGTRRKKDGHRETKRETDKARLGERQKDRETDIPTEPD